MWNRTMKTSNYFCYVYLNYEINVVEI
jgi:hypothetical protein